MKKEQRKKIEKRIEDFQKKKVEVEKSLPEGHEKLVTRRDFLAHGLIAGSAALVVPSFVDLMLAEQAKASGCAPLAGTNMVPLLIIDCSGGWTALHTWLAKDKGGQYLKEYQKVGVSDLDFTSRLTHNFGAPVLRTRSEGFSGFYEGLKKYTSTETQNKIQTLICPSNIANDTGSNKLNFAHRAALAGLTGYKFEGGLTTSGNSKGGRHNHVELIPRFKAIYAPNVNAPSNAASLGDTLNSGLSNSERDSFIKALGKLNSSQLSRLRDMNFGEQYKALMGCALKRAQGNVNPDTSLDPMQFDDVKKVFKISDSDPDTLPGVPSSVANKNRRKQFAAIMHAILTGATGWGNIEISGCDYHNSIQPGVSGHPDDKDFEVATVVGWFMELANERGMPACVALLSDGSAAVGENGTRVYKGDYRSSACALVVLNQNHNGSTPVGDKDMLKTQIGSVTYSESKKSLGVSSSEYTSKPSNLANTMLLNYLALNFGDPVKKLKEIAPDFRPSDAVENYIAFSKTQKPVNRS